MSYRPEKFLRFRGAPVPPEVIQLEKLAPAEETALFKKILADGVHGFCFSLYEEGQRPGDSVTPEQIRKRLEILRPHTAWIRSFSCTEGNELIPLIAKEMGFHTLVGAWLGSDTEKNREEIDSLVDLARKGLVDIAAVGNEVLYRGDLSEEELIAHIADVKARIPETEVGYVDAYYEFVERPAVTEVCDVLLCNCYPYWEGTTFALSLDHMRHMYQLGAAAGKGKRIIITETGWPSRGDGLGEALPSPANALRYFLQAQLWAQANEIELFYFSSFDEAWKVGSEGEVGAYWGVWDSRGNLKF